MDTSGRADVSTDTSADAEALAATLADADADADAGVDEWRYRVVLAGEREHELGPGDLEELPWRERTQTIVCTSGEQYDASWAGVELLDALELAGVPEDTTHVVVTGADGYQVCLDLVTALDSLLAFVRDGDPLVDREGGADGGAGGARVIVPTTDGPRSVKAVDRVEAVALAPGEDPQGYENLLSDEYESGGVDAG